MITAPRSRRSSARPSCWTPPAVEPDAPLEELGIDSKGRIKLLAALEVYFRVTIDLDQLDRFTDVGSVAEVLTEALAGATGGSDERL